MAIPGPSELLRIATEGYEAVEKAIGLVPRVVALLSEVEALIQRVGVVVTGVEETQRRAAAVVTEVERTQAGAAKTVTRVDALLDGFQPALDRLLPIVNRLAETTSEEEVAAIVKLIDALPPIVDRLDSDILPVLDTLATVAPDLRDLLDVSRELNEIIGSVPGLRGVKRRVEEQQADADNAAEAGAEYRADEEPARAPDRKPRKKGTEQA